MRFQPLHLSDIWLIVSFCPLSFHWPLASSSPYSFGNGGVASGGNGRNGSNNGPWGTVLLGFSVSEGLLVDSDTLADGPDPANEDGGHQHLEDTAGDGGAVAASLIVVGSDDGTKPGARISRTMTMGATS